MELTGLKSFKNAGGSVYSSIGSSDNSKTAGYKYISNLPKFVEGTPQTNSNTGNSSSTGSTPMPSATNISAGPTLFGTNNALSSRLSDNFGGWHTDLYVPKVMSTAPTGVDTSGITPNAYALTKYGTNSVKEYFNSPAAVAGAKNITAPVVPTNNGGSGKGFNWSGIGSVVTSGVLFAGDAINSFSVNETGEDLLNKYGTSLQNVAGVGYESQNMIDANKELDRVKKENTGNTLKATGSGAALGAAVGSVIPGLGTAAGAVIGGAIGLFTGLFGGASRKRRYREMLAKQNAKINALQDSSRFSAQTKAIQIQNAKEYGDSESLYLYGAANGKQPEVNPNTGMTKDNFLLATPYGYRIGKADSLVEPGETLFDTKTGSMTLVPRQISDKLHPGDILPAEVGDAAVFTDRHKDPITGKSFALAAIDGDDDPYNLLYRQKVLVNDRKNNKGFMKAKNGRLPKCKEGWVGNAITSGLGALGGLSLWLEAKNSTPKKTNSYRANPYEQEALTTLASLDMNPYPITTQLRNAEARSNKAIDMSGGLSTGQRTLSRLAALHNTQLNIANMLASLLNQRNQYKSAYATAALNAGLADRQARMAAYQWDEDMYAKAHAARQQGMLMGMRNMVDLLNNFYANEFKRRQFNEMMGLYKQDQKLRANEVLAIINNLNSNKNSNYSNYSRVNSITPTYMGDYGLKKDWSIAGNSKLKNPKLFWGKDYSLTAPVLPTSYAAYKYLRPYDNIRLR